MLSTLARYYITLPLRDSHISPQNDKQNLPLTCHCVIVFITYSLPNRQREKRRVAEVSKRRELERETELQTKLRERERAIDILTVRASNFVD